MVSTTCTYKCCNKILLNQEKYNSYIISIISNQEKYNSYIILYLTCIVFTKGNEEPPLQLLVMSTGTSDKMMS